MDGPDQQPPSTYLHVFCAACAICGATYGLLGALPGSFVSRLFIIGPPVAVAMWLARDARSRRLQGVVDMGWFFYIGWPLVVPWYAIKTRGAAGWRLAVNLYGLALAGILGAFLGAVIRYFARALG